MAAPVSLASSQENTDLVNKLATQARKQGLNTEHGFVIDSQHPGVSESGADRASCLASAGVNSGTETTVGGRASVGGATEAFAPESAPRAASSMTGGGDTPAAIQTVTPAAGVKGGQ